MDSSQRALQTNGKLFSNFELVSKLLAENRKKTFLNLWKKIELTSYNLLKNSAVGFMHAWIGRHLCVIVYSMNSANCYEKILSVSTRRS